MRIASRSELGYVRTRNEDAEIVSVFIGHKVDAAFVSAHPHLEARGAFPTVPHPARGEVRVTAAPFQLDGRAVTPAGPAPYRVGEHTRAVLTGLLGYKDREIDDLAQAGAVQAP